MVRAEEDLTATTSPIFRPARIDGEGAEQRREDELAVVS